MKKITLSERLVKVETKLDELIHQFRNHLKHHFWVDIVLLTAILGLIVNLLIKK